MDYKDFSYLWPPRPEKAVPPNLLSFYERRGYTAQHKLNGTCSVIAVSPDREIIAMNRHNEPHKLWEPTPASSAIFKAVPGRGWYVFVAELLHSKVSGGPRDTNYINDILVADSVQLVDTTFMERQKLLSDLFIKGGEQEAAGYKILDSNTWLAKNHDGGFLALYNGLSEAYDEGLVMKKADARLAPCFGQRSNVDWQAKCRHTHKNYSF